MYGAYNGSVSEQEPFDFPPEMFSQVPLFAEIAKAMSWAGGPINWDMARQIATAMASGEHAPPIIDDDFQEVVDAARLAESWLSEATGIAAGPSLVHVRAMTATTWVEHAMVPYAELLDPLGGKLAGALAQEAPPGETPMAGVVRQIVPLFLGIQCGSVLGGLARSILTSYDVPLPVEEEGVLPVLVQHVDAHAREYALDRREMRYWVTLHASAHRLLYESLPWTRTQFWSLYHSYLAALDVNLGETIDRLQALDITSPEQLQSAVGENLFGLGGAMPAGPAFDRLQQFLALMEATCARAVDAAARGKLVSLAAIEESIVRRRAEGAAGERALERFVGIEIPDEVRGRAIAFCDAVLRHGGWALLNTAWDDTDRLPTPDELADPGAWIRRAG